MKTKTINIYSFAELSDEAKDKAIESLYDINVYYPDWDNSIEDAEQIGLKIIELSDHKQNKGRFITNAEDCAKAIIENHGGQCETYKTANKFLDTYLSEKSAWDRTEDSEGTLINDGFPFEYEDEAIELATEFLQSILEDYRIMSNENYDYLTSRGAIIETIEANGYYFTNAGKLTSE